MSLSPSSQRAVREERGCLRFLSRGRYLSDQMCANMLKYKYAGEDKSYLYRFVLTPMNARIIELVPMWAAPNLMSLVGLAVMVSAYALTYLYSPGFDQPLPPWLYVYTAISLFAYQTIDNLDGRQARRTGSSSPLGLLFDHGVDALNCTFASLLLAAVYQIGLLGPIKIFLFWNIGFVPFVFATWEEYWTGKLTLGEINGPSDGMFLCMQFALLGYFVPGVYTRTYAEVLPSLFAGTAVADLTLNSFPLFVGWVGIVFTVIGNCYMVTRKVSLLPRPITKLLPFVLMGVLGWVWVLSEPSHFAAHPRVFCFAFGFLFCQMICNLMIMHICDVDFTLARPALLPLLAAFFNCVVGPSLLPKTFPLVEPAVAVHLLLLANFSMWLHFIWNAILEITALLGIRCFVITSNKTHADAGVALANGRKKSTD